MSANRPPDWVPVPPGVTNLRLTPAGWVAPEIKEIPLLTLANILRRLQDMIEEASTIADSIDFAMLEKQAMEFEEAKRRWESDHPGVPYGMDCMCICGLWRHIGICKGYAELKVDSPPDISRSSVFMCNACEADISAHSN